MIHSSSSSRERLFRLLDRIIGEEQNFKRNSRNASMPNSGGIEASSPDGGELKNDLEHIKRAHEALFKIHRKFINDHELIIQRCFVISRQARAGLLNENEMAMEVERLQGELKRIRDEHRQVEQECGEFLDAHRDYLGDISADN